MDKFEVGDLVRVRSGAGRGKIGLVMETDSHEPLLQCKAANVLIGKIKWWFPYKKLEIVSNG